MFGLGWVWVGDVAHVHAPVADLAKLLKLCSVYCVLELCRLSGECSLNHHYDFVCNYCRCAALGLE